MYLAWLHRVFFTIRSDPVQFDLKLVFFFFDHLERLAPPEGVLEKRGGVVGAIGDERWVCEGGEGGF